MTKHPMTKESRTTKFERTWRPVLGIRVSDLVIPSHSAFGFRHSAAVGSTPTRATVRVVFLTAACKPVVAKEVRWKTRGSIPSQPTAFPNGPFVYRHRTPASHAGKAGSTPARVTAQRGQVVEFGRHATLRRSGPQGRASSSLALATGRDDCRWAGAQPAPMRPVRPDRYRDLQLDT